MNVIGYMIQLHNDEIKMLFDSGTYVSSDPILLFFFTFDLTKPT